MLHPRGRARVGWLALLALGATASVACEPEVQREEAPPPPPLACEVLVDEIVADVGPYGATIAVGADGVPFVAWSAQGGLRVVRREAPGVWVPADAGVQGLPGSVVLAGGGRAGPAMHVLADHIYTENMSHVLRWNGASWDTLVTVASDQALNQNSKPIGIAPDGEVYFSMTTGEFPGNSDLAVALFRVGAGEATELGTLTGRDPSLAVDGSGELHVLYARDQGMDRSLRYGAPLGEDLVAPDRVAWPQAAVGKAGFAVYADLEDVGSEIRTRADDGAFHAHPVGEARSSDCPYHGSFDTDKEGEICDYVARGTRGGVLLGGPRTILVAIRQVIEGPKSWTCPDGFDQPCFLSQGPDFQDTRELVVGAVSPGGVTLSTTPLAIEGTSWTVTGDQDTDGRLHLLVTQDLGSDDAGAMRYVQMSCR